jgi:BolA protein
MSVQQSIENALRAAFAPEELAVVNESHTHNVPPNSETHFKVTLVAAGFADMRRVARHQAVYAVLDEYLKGGVHALALHAYTPEEWRARERQEPASPACMGGAKGATREG